MKKEYIIPQIRFSVFSKEDIVTVSIDDPTDIPTEPIEIQTTINGKTATSYGTVDVSIFDI